LGEPFLVYNYRILPLEDQEFLEKDAMQKKQHIVVTYSATPAEKALFLATLGNEASLTFLNELAPAQREQTLEEATVLLSWNFPQEIRPQDYRRLQQVKFIQLVTAGVDHVPFADLPSHIRVASNAGAYALPMSEHVLALALALAKRLFIEQQKLRNGEFDDHTLNRSLRGMTAGIIGFGGAGRATAHIMQAFGMHIYALNQSGKSSEPTDFIGTLQDLEYVLRASDVVVITLPLTRATRGLIGKKELQWMKQDAILVNVARGAILDEAALYTHLQAYPTFQAGIDTWWEEPLRGGPFRMAFPFLELPNVIGSPHNSALTSHVVGDAALQAAQNIKHFLYGETLVGIIQREDYL
jgi:phosphoglycerate dehydrogenase-like enzyme